MACAEGSVVVERPYATKKGAPWALARDCVYSGDAMKQFSTLLFEIYRRCRTIDSNEYQESVLQLGKSSISFDAALWASGVMTQQGPAIHALHLHQRPQAMIDDYMKIWKDDIILPKVLGSVGTTFAMSIADYQSPAAIEYLNTWDLGSVLSTIAVDPLTQLLTVISFYRSQANAPFTEDDRELKEFLMPHLVETWSSNRLANMLSLSETGQRVNYSSAAVDLSGILHASDDRFAKILREEWSDWRGPKVPERIARHLARNQGRAFVGQSIVVRSNPFKNLIVLRARPKATYDKLSVREQQISQLFATGQSQKEIARSLSISPATVNNHITAVYAKLGINDKAQLAYQVAQFE